MVNEERFILAWGTLIPDSGISLYNPPCIQSRFKKFDCCKLIMLFGFASIERLPLASYTNNSIQLSEQEKRKQALTPAGR